MGAGLALVVAALLAIGVADGRTPSAASSSMQGTLEVGHGDPIPGHGLPTWDFFLAQGTKRIALTANDSPTWVRMLGLAGREVRVDTTTQASGLAGLTHSGGVTVTSAERIDPAAAGARTAAAFSGPTGNQGHLGPHRVLVIGASFQNEALPFSNDDLRTWLTTVAGYYSASSYGRISLQGTSAADPADVIGPFTIPFTNDDCATNRFAWDTAARDAATAAGANLASYDHVIVIWAPAACSFAGYAYVDTPLVTINGTTDPEVLIHELGHSLGSYHAGSLACGSAVLGPTIAGCTVTEYGDPYDPMGSTYEDGTSVGSEHATDKAAYGWLPGQTTVATGPGSWSISPNDTATGLHELRIPRGDGTSFSIEYRRRQGIDGILPATVEPGLQIRIVSECGRETLDSVTGPQPGGGDSSLLLDAHPSTPTLEDAALQPGESFTDPSHPITITATSLGDTAGVTVTGTPGAPVPTPAISTFGDGDGGVQIEWPYSSSQGVCGDQARILRDGTPIATTSDFSYTDHPGPGPHTYAVAFLDPYGTQGATSPAVASPDVTPPSAVAGLVGGGLSDGTVQLHWSPATDDFGVSGYIVYRDGNEIGRTTQTAFGDRPGVGTVSTYGVVAIDAAGNGSLGSSVVVSVPRPVTTGTTGTTTRTGATTNRKIGSAGARPATPSNVHVVRRSRTVVHLSWSSGCHGCEFEVFRNGHRITTTRAHSLTDRGGGTAKRSYRVDAIDAHDRVSARTKTITIGAARP